MVVVGLATGEGEVEVVVEAVGVVDEVEELQATSSVDDSVTRIKLQKISLPHSTLFFMIDLLHYFIQRPNCIIILKNYYLSVLFKKALLKQLRELLVRHS